MSVQKPNFSTLSKDNLPFTVIPNFIYDHVPSLEAIALWSYLIHLPAQWEVNREHLMKRFDIGRDKLNKILKTLIDLYLIKYIWYKNSQGLVDKVSIHINDGMEFLNKVVNNQREESTTLKTRRVDASTTLKIHSVDNPVSGKTAPIKEISNKKEEKDKKKRERPSLNSSSFKPDEISLLLCQDLRLNLAEEMESFENRHKGEKNQYEFQRWLRGSRAYYDAQLMKATANANASPKANEVHSIVPAWTGDGYKGKISDSETAKQRIKEIMAKLSSGTRITNDLLDGRGLQGKS